MEAKNVIRILDEAVIARGCVPEFVRSDHGPEFVAPAVQDWIARRGFKTLHLRPGSPWQNAYRESFNSRFRDAFLRREALASVLEAKVLRKQLRHRHHQERPHSSPEDRAPVKFAQRSLSDLMADQWGVVRRVEKVGSERESGGDFLAPRSRAEVCWPGR